MQSRVVGLVVLVGCGAETRFQAPPPEADVETPVPQVSPPFVQFGEHRRVETATAVVHLVNEGGSSLDLEAITLDGDTSFSLRATPELPLALAHGQGLDVPLAFTARAGGELEGTLTFHFASLDAAPIEVPLAGLGTAPRLVVDPDPVELGDRVLSCPTVVAVTLTNAGKEPLHIDAIDLVDAADGVSLGTPPEVPIVLDEGRSTPVSIAFFPEETGDVSATLVVTSDDPDGERRVPITGSGALGPAGSETFTTPESWGFDLLFALDHSCSMAENMPGIGTELVAFAERLDGVDASWRMGILDGNVPTCLVSGVVEPTQADWRDRVTAGVATVGETALSEALLQDAVAAAALDVPGGCNEGLRRPGAELHVVVMSDERDQSAGFDVATGTYWQTYVQDLRAWAGAPELLQIHAIVDTAAAGRCGQAPAGPGGYADAAAATGGQVLDLCDGRWASALQLVATEISGRVGRFVLSRSDFVPESLAVTLDGTPLATGWTYDPIGPAVTLQPAPPPGSTVVVDYTLLVDCAP